MKVSENCILITAYVGCMNTECDSLESVYAGIQEDADIIEVDIRFDADGVPVLSHDPVNKVQGQGTVMLKEVFYVIKSYPKIIVNLDIKEMDGIESLYKLILSMDLKDKIILTGVEPRYVECVQKYCPGIPYLLNYDPNPAKIFMNNIKYIRELLDMTIKSKAIGINLYYLFATDELINEFHNAGMKVFVWTVDDEEDIEEMIRRRVDSITSCQVDLLTRLVSRTENKLIMEME